MKALILSSLVVVAACHSDARSRESTRNREVAQEREAAKVRELELALERERTENREATESVERKLDELNKKLDRVIAMGGTGSGSPRAPRPEPDRSKVYAVPIDNDPFDGRADAKVTIVKGYDYACGYCEKNRETMEELKKKYGKDLRIVYKQLVIHPKNAMVGALAFCAAAKQGKHREMDRLIWDKGFNARQFDLTEVPLALQPPPSSDVPQMVKCWDHPDGCKNVYGFASELRLDMNRFKADLKGACTTAVQTDGRQLAQFGLSSTPSFFINGRFISGAQQTETFSALIDEELKKANERVAAGTPAASYYQQWVIDKGLKSLEAPKP